METSNIYGILPRNLCYQQKDCKKGRDCGYHHPSWGKGICIYHIKGECRATAARKICQKDHVEWSVLQRKASSESSMDIFKRTNTYEVLSTTSCTKKPKSYAEASNGSGRGPTRPSHKEESKVPPFVPTVTHTREEKDRLVQMRNEMKGQNDVDVLLFMDCTGSMASWINEARDTLVTLIDKVSKNVSDRQLRVAFVGYRDVCDKELRLSIKDFTTDIADIKEYIGKQFPTGGGDEAEDGIYALENGLKLSFSKGLLCSYFIGDAPCHGKQYHDGVGDDQANSIPLNSLEYLMQTYKSRFPKSYFTCLTLNKTTTKMYKIMQDNFQGLVITDQKTPVDFLGTMVTSLTSSIRDFERKARPAGASMSTIKELIGDYTVVKAQYFAIKCSKLPDEPSEEYWKNFPSTLKRFQGETTLKIMNAPLEAGENSTAYRGIDIGRKFQIVLKISLEELSLSEQYKAAEERAKASSYAFQLTKYFRKRTVDIIQAPPIFYVQPIIYVLKIPFFGTTYAYAEPFIDLDQNDWVKYTNNHRGCLSPCLASFSHFSYQFTFGNYMVTDLQGKQFILSDPAIHSKNKKDVDEPTNLGENGFMHFFDGQHKKCSQICVAIGLEKYKAIGTITSSLDILPSVTVTYDQITIICELCNSFSEMQHSKYKDQMKKNYSMFTCLSCGWKLKDTQVEKKCITGECSKSFKYSKYFYECLQYTEPSKCKTCAEIVQTQCQADCPKDTLHSVKTATYLKVTKNGKFPFICKVCSLKKQRLKCPCCSNPEEVSMKKYMQVMNDKSERFVCKKCFEKLKVEFEKCTLCDYKVSKMVLFKKNAGFRCYKCENIKEKLLAFEQKLQEQEFIEGDILEQKELGHFKQVKNFKRHMREGFYPNLQKWFDRMKEQFMTKRLTCNTCSKAYQLQASEQFQKGYESRLLFCSGRCSGAKPSSRPISKHRTNPKEEPLISMNRGIFGSSTAEHERKQHNYEERKTAPYDSSKPSACKEERKSMKSYVDNSSARDQDEDASYIKSSYMTTYVDKSLSVSKHSMASFTLSSTRSRQQKLNEYVQQMNQLPLRIGDQTRIDLQRLAKEGSFFDLQRNLTFLQTAKGDYNAALMFLQLKSVKTSDFD